MFKVGDIIVCNPRGRPNFIGEVTRVYLDGTLGVGVIAWDEWLGRPQKHSIQPCDFCEVMTEDHPDYSTACQKLAIAALTQCQES